MKAIIKLNAANSEVGIQHINKETTSQIKGQLKYTKILKVQLKYTKIHENQTG